MSALPSSPSPPPALWRLPVAWVIVGAVALAWCAGTLLGAGERAPLVSLLPAAAVGVWLARGVRLPAAAGHLLWWVSLIAGIGSADGSLEGALTNRLTHASMSAIVCLLCADALTRALGGARDRRALIAALALCAAVTLGSGMEIAEGLAHWHAATADLADRARDTILDLLSDGTGALVGAAVSVLVRRRG